MNQIEHDKSKDMTEQMPQEELNSTDAPCYDTALAELRTLLIDCVKNRDAVDPELQDEKWKGFIQGVEMAIYRLEMHNES